MKIHFTALNMLYLSLVLIISALIVWKMYPKQPANTRKMYLGDATLFVEVAREPEEITLGLSFRDQLPDDQGVLFMMPVTHRQSFWMKDMRFPLDMIFIRDLRVVEIHENIPAPEEGKDGREIRVVSDKEADMVLEVNAGWVSQHKIEVGDEMSVED